MVFVTDNLSFITFIEFFIVSRGYMTVESTQTVFQNPMIFLVKI